VRRALALGAAFLALPSAAAATPRDTASDRVALHAYHRYVSALVAGIPDGVSADAGAVASVQSDCPGVLRPLRTKPAGSVNRPAVVAFGEEIGGDMSVAFHGEAAAPFAQFATAVGKLRWSSRATARTVSALVRAVRASLAIPQSDLCSDARALASDPLSEPSGTSSFLAAYLPATTAATQQLKPFLNVLSRYQTAGEHRTIASINHLVARFSRESTADENADSDQVLAALGLPSS
jgi:hypothetical protein